MIGIHNHITLYIMLSLYVCNTPARHISTSPSAPSLFAHLLTTGLSDLADDMILVQMGATNPGRSSEEKSKWNAGLRTLLMQLGAAGTRDASTMAAAIAEYRRTFLADPTKVLNL